MLKSTGGGGKAAIKRLTEDTTAGERAVGPPVQKRGAAVGKGGGGTGKAVGRAGGAAGQAPEIE